MLLMEYKNNWIMVVLFMLALLGGAQQPGWAEESENHMHDSMVGAHKISRHEMTTPMVHAGTLDKLVQQLTEVQQQVALEKQAGKEDQKRLQRMVKLLEEEKNMLEKEVKSLEKDKHASRVQRIKWLADKKRIEKALSSSQLSLEQIEAEVGKWQSRLPKALAQSLIPLFEKLEKNGNPGVSQRLQTIIALYTKIEGYQKSVNYAKEVLQDNDGNEREFDVLYIGLAIGYCVSIDGKMAGMGKPALHGWQWQWNPQLAGNVKRAMTYYSHNQIADFVQLPMKLERE